MALLAIVYITNGTCGAWVGLKVTRKKKPAVAHLGIIWAIRSARQTMRGGDAVVVETPTTASLNDARSTTGPTGTRRATLGSHNWNTEKKIGEQSELQVNKTY